MNDTGFIVNGTAEMTELVENIIKATDWEDLRRENQRMIPKLLACLSNTSCISSEQYAAFMDSLNAFKDIATYAFPEGARFKFFKRLSRRFMRVSTNHQQVFNNALLGLLQNMISDMQKLGLNQNSLVEHLTSMEQGQIDLHQEIKTIKEESTSRIIELENSYKELAASNRERLDELNGRLDQELGMIKNRLELLKDAGVDLFSDDEVSWDKHTSSQAGEDSILAYIFEALKIPPDQRDYVDLGANHPRLLSNTYRFYRAGARGVLVEANPKLANELRFYRHRDMVLNRFVASEGGQTMDFYVLNGDGLSTSDYAAVQEFIKENPALEVVDKIQVESIGINEIFDRYLGHAPKILNVDVEGMEMEILRGIDWRRYRPMIVIVEMIPYRKTLYVGEKNRDVLELMNSKGYTEYAFTGINSIFIDTESVKELFE